MLDLVALRKHLHQYPELSEKEFETQQLLIKILQENFELSPKKVGKTGVMVHLGDGELRYLVRVDIDALPIIETNDFDHKSTVNGVAHKCGHDGHTTIGLGLVEKFLDSPIPNFGLTVLFQPAEEIGRGAIAVMEDDGFNIGTYQGAIALHNVPGYELNGIVVKDGAFTPAVHSIAFTLKGKTAHAAEPENGHNPHFAIGQILNNLPRNEEVICTPIYTKIGEMNYGIAPGYGEIHFTLRSTDQVALNQFTENLTEKMKELAEQNNLKVDYEILEKFNANQNNKEIVNAIRKATQNLNLTLIEKNEPFPWGEDFGLFTQEIDGAMFGIGAGKNTPALHNPDYDFPDVITPVAVNVIYKTLLELSVNGK